MNPRRVAGLAFLAGAGALFAASCTSVIGIEDYEDAVDALCKCPALGDIDNCQKVATERLAKDPAKRASWIKAFSESCLCDKAGQCFDRSPTCTKLKAKCGSTAECCGNTKGSAGCCTNLTGPVCCDACVSCSELLDDNLNSGAPTCIESQKLANALIQCACDSCMPVCANEPICGGTGGPGDMLCGECLGQSAKMGGPCVDAAAACQLDKPRG